jgi:hypothetical protein
MWFEGVVRVKLRRVGRPRAALLLFAPALVGLLAMNADSRVVSSVAKKTKTVYCGRHYKPPGCKKPPRDVASAPAAKSQTTRPSPTQAAVGTGGGPRPDARKRAIAWATAQADHVPDLSAQYRGLCEYFAERAYATYGMYADAKAAAAALRSSITPGNPAAAPPGTLLYFRADPSNGNHGHVGIALSGGRMISALSRLEVESVKTRYWRNLYIGWADAPIDWPGRQDPAKRGTSVVIIGPSNVHPLSGQLSVSIRADGAAGVRLAAYYATDPRDATTRNWHLIGYGTPRADGLWEVPLDTGLIPDQGNPQWGTVQFEAATVTEDRVPTGEKDDLRFVIDNGTVVAPPAPSPGQPGATTPETVGGNANTWTDYQTLGGMPGPGIPSGRTVDVTCRVQGYQVADGNTWWYRIATSGWDGKYYASADAFYNNGETTGGLQGTPFVDPAVPLC